MPPIRPELVRCCALKAGFSGRSLLPAVDLVLRSGELLAVLGPNGAGKTTWLRTLIGLVPPVSGSVTLARALKVSYVPQRHRLDELHPLLSWEVVSLGAERGWSFVSSGRRRRERARAALADVGATELSERPFHRLSEGQKQRVLLARVVAASAELALLDEPTSAMDPETEHAAFGRLRDLSAQRGVGVVVVTHSRRLVREYAHRALLLDPELKAAVAGAPERLVELSRSEARTLPEVG